MARTNRNAIVAPVYTHEGGLADRHQKPAVELERAVATCLLWEDNFYETGNDLAQRIAELTRKVEPAVVHNLALKARHEWKLRHVPLWLAAQLISQDTEATRDHVRSTISGVVRRPDEAAELVNLYFQKVQPIGRKMIPRQMKLGLGDAFRSWDAYQLAKWNRDNAVKLRDVLRLVRPKPESPEQAALWGQLLKDELPTPDTWEVALSGGADKREVFTRLLTEKKLGYMALLQNLRNMVEAKVETRLVVQALRAGAAKSWALPFRFLAAAKAAPSLAQDISDAMLLAAGSLPKFDGPTLLLIDVSGSMLQPLSRKSQLTRLDAASALAVLLRETCANVRVLTFSEKLKEAANYRGLPLVKAIADSQHHGGTYLGNALKETASELTPHTRLIVVTDEQAHDTPGLIGGNGYMINVAPYKPGLALDKGWKKINGFSERILDWIRVDEKF